MNRTRIELQEMGTGDAPRDVLILAESAGRAMLDTIECADLRRLVASWSAFAADPDTALPRWASFSPAIFRTMLPKICVLKVGRDGMEYSLSGGHANDYLNGGRSLSVEKMRRDPGRRGEFVDLHARVTAAVQHRAAVYVRKAVVWQASRYVEYETVLLPFAPEGGCQRVLQPVSARIRRTLPNSCKARGAA